MHIDSLLRTFLPTCLALVLAPTVASQCTTEWQLGSGDGLPREGFVAASTVWDPDGTGPMAPRVVVAGDFQSIDNVVIWDPGTGDWHTLRTGLGSTSTTVQAVAALQGGDLVVAGDFDLSGGRRRIARWDGTSWVGMASGLGPHPSGSNSSVRALTPLPNGDLVAAGLFPTASGVTVNNIARWDGSAWSALGSGTNNWVGSLTTMANGDVVAGGAFTTAGGVPTTGLARWNGATWSAFSGHTASIGVRALTALPNGDLLTASGSSLGAGSVWHWDGSNWTNLGTTVNGGVATLTVMPNADIIAAGTFTSINGVAANHIARWDGSVWSAVASGASVNAQTVTALPSGGLLVAGDASINSMPRIEHWDGSSWHELGSGLGDGAAGSASALVEALSAMPNGDLVATGTFLNVGGIAARSIARWNGTAWSALGTGLTGPIARGCATTMRPNGDLIVGGIFTGAGGVAAANIASWNGSSWSSLGSGITGGLVSTRSVKALATTPNGDVLAGGTFTGAGGVATSNIARWDGTAWSALGAGLTGFNSSVTAIVVLPNGDIVVGGGFGTAGGVAANNIARWDGSLWSPLGAGIPGVSSLVVRPNGDLIAGNYSGARRWDGAAWAVLGSGLIGSVDDFLTLPNGDLVAGGYISAPGPRIARWDGASWSPLATQMNGPISSMAMLANGDLAVGGIFTTVENRVSAAIARLVPTCPATVTSLEAGCTNPTGLALQATQSPWLGSSLQTTTTGFAANTLGLRVLGFSSPNLPLTSLIASAAPGCVLLASPDNITVLVPVAGSTQSQLILPQVPVLAGMPVFQQTVQLDVAPLAMTTSNALALVLGLF